MNAPADAPRAGSLTTRLTRGFALSSGLPLLVILPLAWISVSRSYEERALAELEAARADAVERLESMPREVRGDLDRLCADERIRSVVGDEALMLRVMSSEEPFRAADLDAAFVLQGGRFVVNSLEYGNTGTIDPGAMADFERARDPRAIVRRPETLPDGTRVPLVLATRELQGWSVVGGRTLGPAMLERLRERHPMGYVLSPAPGPPFSGALRPRGDRGPLPATAGDLASFLTRTIPVATSAGDWHLTLLRSQEDLHAVRRNLLTLFAVLFGLAVGISWVTGYILAQRIASPVDRLVSALAQVAGGNLDVRVDVGEGPDEIRRMGDAFNRMAADLRDGKQKLLRAERIAAWEEIARRLAHEIKNPLSPIRLAIENTRKAYERKLPEFDEIFHEASTAVLEEVDKLRRIVEEFSLFARLPKPSLTLQSIDDTATGIVKLHDGHPKVRVKADLDGRIPPFLFDQDQIHRVLMNLVQNAIDASPDGAEVTVATRLSPDGRAVVLSVTDRGPGISPDVREKLFAPYVTTKAHGTGLGLAISARIVEEHGGTVDALPAAPGTTFAVTLPVAGIEARGEKVPG